MKKTIISGTGAYVPPRVVSNNDLTKWMDTSDEWISKRSGVKQRYWVPEEGGVAVSDLGLEASNIALQRAGWEPKDIDLIIFSTLSPDIDFPGSGCLLQHKLGLNTTPALDIRQQCSAFMYGITIVDSFIKSGYANRILFVGAEIHSGLLDISTKGRDLSVLFGDGAGAVCYEGVDTDKDVGVLASALHAQGEFAGSLMMESPGSRFMPRITEEMIRDGKHYPVMDGRTVFKQAIRRLPEVANEALEKAGLSVDDIDLVIPHQANIRINQAFMKAMKMPEDKLISNIHKYGNTTAASIPIALNETIEKKHICAGTTVFFIGLGAGFTWGCVIFRF